MKNKILKTITGIMAVLFILAASGIDANTQINHIICVIAEVWFILFLLANIKALKTWMER